MNLARIVDATQTEAYDRDGRLVSVTFTVAGPARSPTAPNALTLYARDFGSGPAMVERARAWMRKYHPSANADRF